MSSRLGVSPAKEMKVNASIWDRLTRVVASLAAVAALVWVAVLYFPLMHQNEVMRQQIAQLDRQIRQEEAANRQVRLEIDSLKTDPKTVERLAREQLGLARPDETVVRFENPGE
ncbi:MAG: septum formation initiator family protein [Verrucomicrobiota bacterium]|nr:septum formation initiator family protein [Verrucomicrobiota bacterium]